MAIVLTEQEYQDWLVHPATKCLFKALTNDREFIKEQLIRGNIDNEEEAKGRCNAVLNIINIGYEDLVEGAREDAKY